jgi:maleamate amidohydrolase
MAARVGWGSRPALLVVDLQTGFTDPECPLGANQDAAVAATARLAAVAHSVGVPVIYTVTRYRPDLSDGGIWPLKMPSQHNLVEGSRWTELDPRIGYLAGDRILFKQQASAFMGTSLADDLHAAGIDTVLVCGATTSGCVRASAVDSCGAGFRTLVVRDAVGDRHPLVHEVSLFDLDSKYADVIDEASAVAGILARG